MAKTLQRVGNSLALIIDAPIRHALGIGTKTKLSIRTDGRHPLAYLTHAALWHKGGAATPADFQTMRRMETCLLALQDNKSWDEAIEIALQRWPLTCRESPKS